MILAAVKEDAAVAIVSSQLHDIFILNENQRMAPKTKYYFHFTPNWQEHLIYLLPLALLLPFNMACQAIAIYIAALFIL